MAIVEFTLQSFQGLAMKKIIWLTWKSFKESFDSVENQPLFSFEYFSTVTKFENFFNGFLT